MLLIRLAAIPPPPVQELVLGPLRLRMYGLCIALGVLAAVWIGQRRWARSGGDPDDITTIALVAVPAGLVGARLYHVITDWSSKYSGGRWWPDAFMVWKGGLGIPGGVLLGTAAGVLMARRIRVDWRRCADALAPALPVAQAIGRLGNYFNQELYGRPTSLPWGLEVDPGFRPLGYQEQATFHPTFLYEGLWNLALAGAIVLLGRRWVLRPGRWFAVYIAGYGLGRLWVESLRIDDATRLLGLRVNIWTSLLAIVGGLLWLFWGGNPVDRDATRRLRDGEAFAAILDMPPSRAQLIHQRQEAALAGEGAPDGPAGAEVEDDAAEESQPDEPEAVQPTGRRLPPLTLPTLDEPSVDEPADETRPGRPADDESDGEPGDEEPADDEPADDEPGDDEAGDDGPADADREPSDEPVDPAPGASPEAGGEGDPVDEGDVEGVAVGDGQPEEDEPA